MKKTLRPLAASSCISIAAIIFLFSGFSFGQGNSGNNGNGQGNGSTSLTTGGSGKPPVSSLGLGKFPMWGLSGNSTDSTAIFGTTNDMPVKVVVNNIHRGSFTNTGFEIYGNSYSTSSTIDSILTAWQVMVNDALSVAGNLSVSGNASVSGFLMAGQITINGNSVNSSSGNINLGNNDLSTTGTITGSNITSLTDDVSGLQVATVDQQAEIDSLQTTVGNIKSSQWQNDTVNPSNIFYSGNVGIGVSNPSVPLEVAGSLKITGSDTTGSGGGGGGGTPPPAPSRSIIIDGGLDRITATSGTLDFDNTNLTTTGSFQSSSITTANLTILDRIESDTMHARRSLEINNSLRLKRDNSVMYAEMSTKDTAVALMLQKDAAAPVVIGDAPAPPPGESRAKLTVAGNTKLDGQLNVSGNIISSGTISANNVSIENDFTANKIISNRITSTDSILWIGDSSLGFMGNVNRIIGSTSGFYRGLGLGVNATVRGLRSTAIGKNVKTEVDGENAVVIGSGMGNAETTFFTNNIPNSLMVGFNTSGNVPTLFVSPADGSLNSTGNIGIGTSNPQAKLQVDNGSVFIRGESQGVIVDESANKRVGLIKYPGRAAGIWRTTGQSFEIGRTNVSSLPGSPTSFTTDLLIGGDGNVSINDANDIKLRNTHHGLGWYGDPNGNSPGDKNFATVNIDGPVLYGWKGGALGVKRLEYDESLYQDVEIERIALRWDERGNVGIGTTNPDEKLQINGVAPAIHLLDYAAQGNTTDTTSLVIRVDNGAARLITNQSFAIFINGDNNDDNRTFEIKDNGNFYGGTAKTLFQINENGNATLYGTLQACSVMVNVLTGCDFVFDENYPLLTLKKRKEKVLPLRHLLNVAPAKEMEKSGVDLGQTTMGILQNVEEHELYLYEHDERIGVLENENKQLRLQNQELKVAIMELQKAIKELKK